MKIKILTYLIILSIILIVFSGCTENHKEKYIYGNATIENIDVQISDSIPDKINVTLKGYLRDSCTEMDKIESKREKDIFYISIKTIRPANLTCENLPYFFEKVISLDTQKLSPGIYYVMANNMNSSFEIKADGNSSG